MRAQIRRRDNGKRLVLVTGAAGAACHPGAAENGDGQAAGGPYGPLPGGLLCC
jgi:hypothetical protein